MCFFQEDFGKSEQEEKPLEIVPAAPVSGEVSGDGVKEEAFSEVNSQKVDERESEVSKSIGEASLEVSPLDEVESSGANDVDLRLMTESVEEPKINLAASAIEESTENRPDVDAGLQNESGNMVVTSKEVDEVKITGDAEPPSPEVTDQDLATVSEEDDTVAVSVTENIDLDLVEAEIAKAEKILESLQTRVEEDETFEPRHSPAETHEGVTEDLSRPESPEKVDEREVVEMAQLKVEESVQKQVSEPDSDSEPEDANENFAYLENLADELLEEIKEDEREEERKNSSGQGSNIYSTNPDSSDARVMVTSRENLEPGSDESDAGFKVQESKDSWDVSDEEKNELEFQGREDFFAAAAMASAEFEEEEKAAAVDGLETDALVEGFRRLKISEAELEEQLAENEQYDNLWGEDQSDISGMMSAADQEYKKVVMAEQSRLRAKRLEDEEAEDLMKQWGFDKDDLDDQDDPFLKAAMEPGPEAFYNPPPPLAEGFDSAVLTEDGGMLLSMAPEHFADDEGKLVMQVWKFI